MGQQLVGHYFDTALWALTWWREGSGAVLAGLPQSVTLGIAALTLLFGIRQARLLSVLGTAAAAGFAAWSWTLGVWPALDSTVLVASATGVGVLTGAGTASSRFVLELATRLFLAAAILAVTVGVAAFSLTASLVLAGLALLRPTVGVWTVSCSLLVLGLDVESGLGVWTIWILGNLLLFELSYGRYLAQPRVNGRVSISEAVRAGRLSPRRLTAFIRAGWGYAR